MKIIDARWTPAVNLLTLLCPCGRRWEHRADRWACICPGCGRRENLGAVRDRYVREGPG